MTTTDTARAEAVGWLVGRLRFEALLADLRQHADDLDVVEASVVPFERPLVARAA